MPLNQLNHVNIYLLADGDGWAMIDSGFGNEETIAAWTALFEGPLKNFKITRLIVTHFHPDHVGLAGRNERMGVVSRLEETGTGAVGDHRPHHHPPRPQKAQVRRPSCVSGHEARHHPRSTPTQFLRARDLQRVTSRPQLR